MTNIEGKCISDEELRGEYIHDLAVQAVDHACDLSEQKKGLIQNHEKKEYYRGDVTPLSIDEWHEMIDEMIDLLSNHRASEANR